MAEDEEETGKFDVDEFIEAVEEQRRERREQASYEWVETIRKAGELYRDSEDVDAVLEELDRLESTTREALTVYRLIFKKPPEEVAMKASTPGRAFFSLDQDVEEMVDGDDEEPVEDLLREYVGAIYLGHDVDEEPVGDPPRETTPPPAMDFSEIAESLSNAVANIKFPKPLLADLASIQPAINAAAVAGATSAPPAAGRTVVDETSTTTAEFEPLEAAASTITSPSPVNATVDATLPDSDTIPTEFVFEIPALLVQSMLSTGQVRIWFTNLPEDHQITVIRLLLASVVVSITGNPFFAPIAIIPAPAVRQAIIINED